MANLKNIQADFTAGVLDPEVAGRVDVDLYYKGVQRGDNVVPQAQGGLTRRPGTRRIDTLPKRLNVLGGTDSLISGDFTDTDLWPDIGAGDVTSRFNSGAGPELTSQTATFMVFNANGEDTGMHAATLAIPPGRYTYSVLVRKFSTNTAITFRLRMGNQLCFLSPNLIPECYEPGDTSITLEPSDNDFWYRLIATVDKTDFGRLDVWITTDGAAAETVRLYGGLLYKGDLVPDQLALDVTAPEGGTAANLIDGDRTTNLLITTELSDTNDLVICQIDMGRPVDIGMVDLFDIQLVGGTMPEAPVEALGEFILEGVNDPDTPNPWLAIGDPLDIVDDLQARTYRRGVENNPQKTVISPNRSIRYIRLVRRNPTGIALFDLGDWHVQLSQMRIMTTEIYSEADAGQAFAGSKSDSTMVPGTWVQDGVTITINQADDENGEVFANQINETGGAAAFHRLNIENADLRAGTRYRQELVARSPGGVTGRQYLRLVFGTLNSAQAVFDLDNGTIVSNPTGLATMTPILNSVPTLYRCRLELDITVDEIDVAHFEMSENTFGGQYSGTATRHQFWANGFCGVVPPLQPLSPSKMLEFAFNTEQTYVMIMTDQNITIVNSRDSANPQGTELNYQPSIYTADELQEVDYVQSADTMLFFHRDAGPTRLVRLGETDWRIEDFIITVPSEDIDGLGEGPIFSPTRGWPQTATFYQQRLWIGGSTLLPNRMIGSTLTDLFDFDTGSGDTGPVDISIDSDQINSIQHLRASRRLEIFTSGEEYTSNAGLVSPSTIAVTPQSAIGIKKGLKPLSVDGATLFIGRNLDASAGDTSTLWQFLFDFAEDAHRPSDVALLSSNLLTNPIDMDARASKQSYVYIVNDDGTMAVFLTSRQQNVAAWSRWTFAGGKVRTTAVLQDGNHYGVIDYENSSTDRGEQFSALVLFDETQLLDSQQNFPVDLGMADNVAATDPLQTPAGGPDIPLKVILNATGPLPGTFTAEPVGGVVQLGGVMDLTQGYSLGKQIDVRVTTMPTSFALPKGVTFGEYLRLVKCMLRLYNTQAIEINGRTIPFFDDRLEGFDADSGLLSGFLEEFLDGWQRDAQITVSQSEPYPFTLLSANIEYEV